VRGWWWWWQLHQLVDMLPLQEMLLLAQVAGVLPHACHAYAYAANELLLCLLCLKRVAECQHTTRYAPRTPLLLVHTHQASNYGAVHASMMQLIVKHAPEQLVLPHPHPEALCHLRRRLSWHRSWHQAPACISGTASLALTLQGHTASQARAACEAKAHLAHPNLAVGDAAHARDKRAGALGVSLTLPAVRRVFLRFEHDALSSVLVLDALQALDVDDLKHYAGLLLLVLLPRLVACICGQDADDACVDVVEAGGGGQEGGREGLQVVAAAAEALARLEGLSWLLAAGCAA
jgi:hypothetical protein